jgi:chromate transport protein ChrA
MGDESGGFGRHRREIAPRFVHLGATSYGGRAIAGIMRAELQEERRWVSRERRLRGCRR